MALIQEISFEIFLLIITFLSLTVIIDKVKAKGENRMENTIERLGKILEKLSDANAYLEECKYGSVARELDETRTEINRLIEDLENQPD